jgi:hypothetical protein
MIEVRYEFLLFTGRYAHINLPTMRGLNVMMVMLARVRIVHMEGQYTNANGIWQARLFATAYPIYETRNSPRGTTVLLNTYSTIFSGIFTPVVAILLRNSIV